MARFIGLICFLAFTILSATARDKDMREGDVDVKVLGQSGKMTFGRSMYGFMYYICYILFLS